jgi:phage gp29-like protein
VPFGADLVLRGVEGTLPDADPAIRYHDEQIARAVLAHFLNLGTQTGSWALGTTFADFFTLSLQTLAQQIADTATQHIIEDLVDANFGENEPAPRLVFDEIGSRQAATAEALKSLVDAGIVHPDQVLEETSRQQYGLRCRRPIRPRRPR